MSNQPTKRCGKCGETKPIDQFHKSPRGSHGRFCWCAKCSNEYAKQNRTRIATPEKRRKWNLSIRYGLSEADFDAMLVGQGGLCAICALPMKRVCIDHDHATGEVRKLLCNKCNVLLGLIENNRWMEPARRYLASFSKTVAVLCASKNSAYHGMPGVEVYDADRNAMTFSGGMRIIAHPPCRSWSAFCRHQAKPNDGERDLGLWCASKLRECGGVLEQPAFSHLWKAANLPMPGETSPIGCLWSTEVWQSWFGYQNKKRTWLCFSNIPRSAVNYPLTLAIQGGDKRRWQLMGAKQRSHTTKEFAEWLVKTVRQ